MRRLGVALVAAITVVATMLLTGPVQAFASARTAVPGGRPPWATANAFRGQTPGSDRIGFRVYLGWRSDPSSLISAVTTPGSPQYGHYLTAAQFRAQFAPSAADVQAVEQWLSSSGIKVDYVPANNLYVAADGSVAQAESAFSTTIGYYQVDGQLLRAPETDPTVPAGLPQVTVAGLDDSASLVQPDIALQQSAGGPKATPPAGFVNAPQCGAYWGADTTANTSEPAPVVTSTGTISTPAQVPVPPYGSTNPTPFTPCGYTPAQVRSAYGLSATATGAGQTVAIIDAYASPTIVSDVNTYFSRHNVSTGTGNLIPPLSASNFTQVVAPGTFNHPESGKKQDPQGWYGEETLDVESVHLAAPDANIVYVGAPNNFQDLDAALNHVVDKHLASMVTNSYGFAGEALAPGFIKPYLDVMEEAAATGIGVYFSSGDAGDETGGVAGATPTPDWPASSPLVTAVGGTSLDVNATGQRAGEWGWETSNVPATDTSGTLTWGKPAYDYGSGGGVSRLFAEPAYQQGVVPSSIAQTYGSTPMRVVPDVSALGDPNTGLLIGETQSFPTGDAYGEYRIGGTSLASPLFTGIMADVQQLAGPGADIGFANPLLYSNGGSFDDIKAAPAGQALVRSDFVNSLDASAGYSVKARTVGDDGSLTIHVTNGYDDVTGLGSPNGPSWLSALAGGAAG